MTSKTAEEVMHDALMEMSKKDIFMKYFDSGIQDIRSKIDLTLMKVEELRLTQQGKTNFINEALLPHYGNFNPFTAKLKEVLKEKGHVFVKVRNKTYEKIFWKVDADHEYFANDTGEKTWSNCGTSYKNASIDLMEFDL